MAADTKLESAKDLLYRLGDNGIGAHDAADIIAADRLATARACHLLWFGFPLLEGPGTETPLPDGITTDPSRVLAEIGRE